MIDAGDIKQLLIDGREMDTASEGEVGIQLSGYNNEVSATANGGLKRKRTRKPGMLKGIPILINWERKDLEYLQSKADANEPIRVKMVLVNGTVYNAVRAIISSEIEGTSSEAQCDIDITSEKLEQF